MRPIVRACHERWDGDGYPDRLRGEEIPVEARIIFACDAFHAMTTDRPYRERLSGRGGLRRLREARGTQFDPRVVDGRAARAPRTPREAQLTLPGGLGAAQPPHRPERERTPRARARDRRRARHEVRRRRESPAPSPAGT